jgi:hypothetical protein
MCSKHVRIFLVLELSSDIDFFFLRPQCHIDKKSPLGSFCTRISSLSETTRGACVATDDGKEALGSDI